MSTAWSRSPGRQASCLICIGIHSINRTCRTRSMIRLTVSIRQVALTLQRSGFVGCCTPRFATGILYPPPSLEADSSVPMSKRMLSISRKKDKNNSESTQKKLLELHQKMIALEKLDIRRQDSLISATEMKKAFRKLFHDSKECIAILQDRKIVCISPPLARLLGYTQIEMFNISFASYIHPQALFRLAEYYLHRI